MKNVIRIPLLWLAAGVWAAGQITMPWDLPPLRYSDTEATDPLAKLGKLPGGEHPLTGKSPLERLALLLDLLEVPVESQILVFSKTSAQNSLIQPENPRCFYFNENSYVGYVPGGKIEVISQDPVLGVVFYLISTDGEKPPRIERDSSSCLSCHGTARTEHVPGPLVRSVHPDGDGRPLLALGTSHIDHSSPVTERWGGYYVTGSSSLPHMGNRTYTDSSIQPGAPLEKIELDSVIGKVPAVSERYPRATSDIVALMVLEHQCRVHNLLNSAGLSYRRAFWLARSFDPEADPDSGAAGRVAASAVEKLADVLLFKEEAALGDNGLDGDVAYQKAFAKRYPKSAGGRSLADFQLHSRLFKYRCSYMVYSSAFRSLPAAVRQRLLDRLALRLGDGEEAAGWIAAPERRKIREILADTLPDWET